MARLCASIYSSQQKQGQCHILLMNVDSSQEIDTSLQNNPVRAFYWVSFVSFLNLFVAILAHVRHCEKKEILGFLFCIWVWFSGFVEITTIILILIFLDFFFFFLALDMLMGYFCFCSAFLYSSLLIGLE